MAGLKNVWSTYCVSHQPAYGVDCGEALVEPHPMQYGHLQAVCVHGPHRCTTREGSGCLTDWIQLKKLEDR